MVLNRVIAEGVVDDVEADFFKLGILGFYKFTVPCSIQ